MSAAVKLKEVTINEAQKLYVIPCGGGYTTFGFESLYKSALKMREKLKAFHANNPKISVPDVSESEIGTMNLYYVHEALSGMCIGKDLGIFYHLDTPAKVQAVLNRYMQSREKIRIFYGDVETGKDWMEENDIIGEIGKSNGHIKVPLMIADGESGGPSLLDHCIVKMVDVKTGDIVYQHPQYHIPGGIELAPASDVLKKKGYAFSVKINKEVHANFKKIEHAAEYITFMTGKSFKQPKY